MILPTELAARIARLLPHLASDQTGEVAATAAAINRVLKANGHDWHDLAAHVARQPPQVLRRDRPPAPRPAPRDYGDWRSTWRTPRSGAHHLQTVNWCRGFQSLTPWERQFLDGLAGRLNGGFSLSERQSAVLRDIGARFGAAS